MNILCRIPSFGNRRHGQIIAATGTIAACPDPGKAGTPGSVDLDLAAFQSSDRVTELAQGTPAASLGVASGSLKMDAPLRRAQWANVGLVVLVALALRVLFVSGLVGVFFLVFGAIAMDLNTISSWTQSDPRVLLHLPWSGTAMTVELLQVSAFMASFSGFYFSIRVLTDHEYRDEFFEDVVGDVRQSLAVRAVYLGALAQHEMDGD